MSRNICQSLQQRWQGHGQQEMCNEEQQIANPFEYQPMLQNRDKDEDGLEADTVSVIGVHTQNYHSIQ